MTTDPIALGGLLIFLSGYGLGVLVAWRLGWVKLP